MYHSLDELQPTVQEILAIQLDVATSPTLHSWWEEGTTKYGRRLNRGRILAMMGIINLITFKLGIEHGALYEAEENKWLVNKDKLRSLIVNCSREQVKFQMPLTGVGKYLKRYWSDASSSQPFLRKLRVVMSKELGLFEWNEDELEFVPRPASDRATPCVLHSIDFERLLLVMQQLEMMLKTMSDDEISVLEMLPSHYGNWTRMLFNAWFQVIEYNRKRVFACSEFAESVDMYNYSEVAQFIDDEVDGGGYRPEGEVSGSKP